MPALLRAVDQLAAARRSAGLLGAVLLAVVLLCASCAERQPPAPPQAPPETAASVLLHRERPYLLNPLEGYAQNIDPIRRDRLSRAYTDLVDNGSVAAAADTASDLLGVASSLAPAKVLAAQTDFAQSHFRAVVDRLLPVGDAQPNYTASQMLLGRAAELLGDVPLAYAAYRAIAPRSRKALERTGDLHARALQIVAQRLDAALRGTAPDRLAEAQRQLALLQAWAPGEPPALEGARALAVARHDPRAELEAVKGLSARAPDDRELLERRSTLELEVGDPGTGLKIVQDLAERHPGDAELADKVRYAKFRWRLSLLPADVRAMAAKPEISRADFSVLLYWLVPTVRYAKPGAGRIATDLLDDPHREEIVHVLNLGLLDVDPNLHRFSPAATVRRGVALRCLARLLTGFGSHLTCAQQAGGPAANPCSLAVSCGLITDDDACDAGEALAGADALDWIQRSLVLLGGV